MLETVIGILSTAFFIVVGWSIQLGNRVTIVETKQEDLTELINRRFDFVEQRLGRIEDGMNGHLKGE